MNEVITLVKPIKGDFILEPLPQNGDQVISQEDFASAWDGWRELIGSQK